MESGLVHWRKTCPLCRKSFTSSKMDSSGSELCEDCESKLGGGGGGGGGGRKKVETQGWGPGGKKVKVTLYAESGRVIGHGAFGTVYKMKSKLDGRKTEYVALKEPRFDDDDIAAEVAMLEELEHPNLVALKFLLLRQGLRLVATELVADGDLYHFISNWFGLSRGIGMYAEAFGFQMFRGLGYLHYHRIAHRDVKPENLLVSAVTGVLKICDFGCAKKLSPGRGRDSCCIGTKEFRAPELLLHSKTTTVAVDVWSGAVVMTEMVGGRPIFGEGPQSEVDQLERIAAFLGVPRVRHTKRLNSVLKLLAKRQKDAERRSLKSYCAGLPGLCDNGYKPFWSLLRRNLQYRPSARMKCYDICAHEYFTPLFESEATLPNGNPLPSTIFEFQAEEVSHMSKEAAKRLSSHSFVVHKDADVFPEDVLGF